MKLWNKLIAHQLLSQDHIIGHRTVYLLNKRQIEACHQHPGDSVTVIREKWNH